MSEASNFEKDMSLAIDELWESLGQMGNSQFHRACNGHCTEDLEVVELASRALRYQQDDTSKLETDLEFSKERERVLQEKVSAFESGETQRQKNETRENLENYSKHLDQVMLPGWMATVKDYDLIKTKGRPEKMMKVYLEMKSILMQAYFPPKLLIEKGAK